MSYNYMFSASRLYFFMSSDVDSGVYSSDDTDDAVAISDDEFITYGSGTAPVGKQLGSTHDGRPCWVDIPPPSQADQVVQADATKAVLQHEAEEAIKPLERARALGIATPEELALLLEWEKYSVYLMRVDTSTAPDITWPAKPSAV